MTMTTTMWKRTKKILADACVTEAKPLLRSEVTLRNHRNTNLKKFPLPVCEAFRYKGYHATG